MKEYIPNPVDTGHIQLPKELEYLVEEMAKNVHEVWSKTRIEQGWTYGEKRDDALKQHPCLIPYEELPEEEKVYDRNSSVETLKLIMKLGFKISKDEKEMMNDGNNLIQNLFLSLKSIINRKRYRYEKSNLQ